MSFTAADEIIGANGVWSLLSAPCCAVMRQVTHRKRASIAYRSCSYAHCMGTIYGLGLLFLFALTATAQNDLPAMKRIDGEQHAGASGGQGVYARAQISPIIWKCRPAAGGAKFTRVADLKLIRAEGFDHIRLPVGWHQYTGPAPDFKLSGGDFCQGGRDGDQRDRPRIECHDQHP